MSNNKKDTIEERIRNLRNPTLSDEALTDKFTAVFTTPPIVQQRNYALPTHYDVDTMDKELEDLLGEDLLEEDLLGDEFNQSKDQLDAITQAFVGHETTDEVDELMKRVYQEQALDQKYSQFNQQRDEQLEKRRLELKKSIDWTPSNNKPKGKIPTPFFKQEDEVDDWCCICNEDAVVECFDCEDGFCKGCFHYTHRSASADYEATKHKSRIKK
ncbi:hypothetical protein BD560DRAFT_393440 [Blakeslea trispora]|nr:hypothetical protein BD560DRAFT_393440 [Blakeslea trispora]